MRETASLKKCWRKMDDRKIDIKIVGEGGRDRDGGREAYRGREWDLLFGKDDQLLRAWAGTVDWSRCTWPLRVPERVREEGEGKGRRGVVIVWKNLQKLEYKSQCTEKYSGWRDVEQEKEKLQKERGVPTTRSSFPSPVTSVIRGVLGTIWGWGTE